MPYQQDLKHDSMKPLSRWIILASALMMAVAIFLPIWNITLDAPQYPEGLVMQITASGVKGNVDQINELNHYIGMKPILNEEFPEFRWMPFILGTLAVLGVIIFYSRKRLLLYAWIFLILLLGIAGIADFYQWEYMYGHHLDPAAAIKIPGMAYQPPLIGYKQLLNFLAGSLPGAGGYCIILSGMAAACTGLYEFITHRGTSRVKSHNVYQNYDHAAAY